MLMAEAEAGKLMVDEAEQGMLMAEVKAGKLMVAKAGKLMVDKADRPHADGGG